MRKTPWLLFVPLAWTMACDSPTTPIQPIAAGAAMIPEGANVVSVLTQNLYLGADIAPLALVPPGELPFAAAEVWARIQGTDFPTRAQALADEIAATRPHMIGLQEVTTWRTQTPSDFIFGQYLPNATTVAYDFLSLLLDALADRGLSYQLAALSPTSDVELPVYTGTGSIPFMDLRWTDADAVLVRADVDLLQAFAYQYAAGGSIQKSGWAAARVRIGRRDLTFISTHLIGAEDADIQTQQAAQLIEWAGLQPEPVILVGDFNSPANPGAPAESLTDTYSMLLGAGFTDVWDRGRKAESGLTCCHAELLDDETIEFHYRGDFVFLDQGLGRMVGAVQAAVLGTDYAVRETYGLWPSDHAGVFAAIHLPMW